MLMALEGRSALRRVRALLRTAWPGRVTAIVCLTLVAVTASATDVAVNLRAPNGAPVTGAVLVLEATASGQPPRHHERQTARMEQRGRRFIPDVLVVQTGTLVEFPNNDTVSHQVYSFSPARRFELSLYKGTGHAPIEFDKAGLVVLGCNIHDEMIGYILVTDSPYFTQTDAQGLGRVTGVPAGAYRLRVWGPRIADAPSSLERTVQVGESGAVDVNFALGKPLLAAPRAGKMETDAY